MMEKLQEVKTALFDWNKNVFGFLEKSKRILLARLRGIQNFPNYPHSSYLCCLEKELQLELDQLLKKEELKWFQKARTEWITKGDRNTKYYHLKATMRKKRNKIRTLMNESGVWIEDETKLQAMAVRYLKNLYQSEEDINIWHVVSLIGG